MGAKYTEKTIRKFDQFMKAVPHSNIYYSYDIKNSEMKYQCFISGSDQVWNPDTCSDEWFLNFLDNKKLELRILQVSVRNISLKRNNIG